MTEIAEGKGQTSQGPWGSTAQGFLWLFLLLHKSHALTGEANNPKMLNAEGNEEEYAAGTVFTEIISTCFSN